MRETFNNRPIYTLSEITQSLQNVISRTYTHSYYVKAEILKLNYYPHSGHCFPELVEKENGKIKAEMRAIIWSSQFQTINDRFITITGEPLKENISILCLASVEFSARYGLSLHIEDVEPIYTLGEMERNRREAIAKLKKEGVFDANKKLKLALVPKRVAVISVETSKGFSDFMVTLQQNSWNYKFECELFPSILQGDKAIVTISQQIAEIVKRQQEFDCIVIVRGGGGDVGLSCYDDYSLAKTIATAPLPIIAGIGHSTNETVSGMVAFANKITPTEVAYFLIQQYHNFSIAVEECQTNISNAAFNILKEENFFFSQIGNFIRHSAEKFSSLKKQQIESESLKLKSETKILLDKKGYQLKELKTKVDLLHPDNVLKRGYSITMQNGKAIRNADEIVDDIIITKLYKGTIKSKIEK